MKYFKFLLFSFTLFFLTTCAEDDPIVTKGSVYGRITENLSNESIIAAQVSISGIQQSVSTGQDGSYQFSDITAGSYSITTSKPGYITDVKTVSIVAGRISNGDFSLEKELPIVNPSSIILDSKTLEVILKLENTTSSVMNFTTSLSKNWLEVSPANSSIDPMNTKLLTLTADLANVPFGNYEEVLIINVGQASLSIPIAVNHVEPPNISITNPGTDQTYVMGEVMPINWNSNLEGNVKIELFRYSSVFLTISEEESNENGGSFSWEIPALEEEDYQLTITSLENGEIFDKTNAFSIISGPTKPTVVNGSITELLSTNIKIEGEITNIGLEAQSVDQYGHVYSKNNTNPTIADFKTTLGTTLSALVYESNITGLEPGVSYHVNAYATNSQGTAYGDVITVTPPAGAPIVNTSTVSEITKISAVTGGNVISDGGNNLIERGLCWGTKSPVTIDSNTIKDGQNIEGDFTTNLTSLGIGKTYYVRAYAINSEGVGYGEQLAFTTLAGVPTVETKSASTIDVNKVSVDGEVSDNGGADLSSYGFVYSITDPTPTVSNSVVEVGKNIQGLFSSEIDGLQASTSYYVRAYATNEAGTSYGDVISVDTAEGNYLNIISPSQNESIDINISYTIQWESNYDNVQVLLQHYRDGTFISDIGVVNVLNNSFQWSTKRELLASDANTIRIVNNSTLEIISESKVFTTNKYFELISPKSNTGYLSNALKISWFSNSQQNIKISLYNGSQLIGIISNQQIQDQIGLYSNSFTLNNLNIDEGENYRLRFVDYDSQELLHMSYLFELIDTTYTDLRDGNVYDLVQIGNQIWMAEDLRHMSSAIIPNEPRNTLAGPTDWPHKAGDGSFLYPVSSYSQGLDGIAPDGWRVPTREDWNILESQLGMDPSVLEVGPFQNVGNEISGEVGKKLKSTSFGGTNSSGFNITGFNNAPYRDYFYTESDVNHKIYKVDFRGIMFGITSSSVRIFFEDYDGIGRYHTGQSQNTGSTKPRFLPLMTNYTYPLSSSFSIFPNSFRRLLGVHVRLVRD